MDEILRAAVEATQAQAKIRVMTADEIAGFAAKLVCAFRGLAAEGDQPTTAQVLQDASIASLIPSGAAAMALPASQPDAQPAQPVGATVPKCNPKTSIRKEKIVCIECGHTAKMLTSAHLARHGLTPEQYKEKWGLSPKAHLMSHDMLKRQRDSVVDMRQRAKQKRETKAKA